MECCYSNYPGQSAPVVYLVQNVLKQQYIFKRVETVTAEPMVMKKRNM